MLTKAVFIWSKYSKNSTIMKYHFNKYHFNILICKVEKSCACQDDEYEGFV